MLSNNQKLSPNDLALHKAVEKGEEETVIKLLAAGASPKSIGDMKETPLHVAARHNRTAIMRHLINAGASLEARNYDNEKPIHVAAIDNAVDAVTLLVTQKKDQLLTPGRDNCTVLRRAAWSDSIDVMRALLQLGDDVNQGNSYFGHIIHIAATKHTSNMMRLLLEYRVDTTNRNEKGHTALQVCATQNTPSVAAANELLKASVNPNEGNPSPLYLLADHSNPDSDAAIALAKLLIEKGANVDAAFAHLVEREKIKEISSDSALLNLLSQARQVKSSLRP